MKTQRYYYRAIERDGFYCGQVYHYDPTGDVIIPDWTSTVPRKAKETAMDDACEWAEDQGIDAEADYS